MEKRAQKACPCRGGTLVRFVQPMIIALLKEAPCHGYILLRRIARTDLWQGASPDPAGIYRILRDMEARGLIRSQISWDAQEAKERKLYYLTDAGRECGQNWLRALRQYQRDLDEIIHMLSGDPDGPHNS